MSLYGSEFGLLITLVIVAMAVHQATNVLLRSSLFAQLRDKFETGEETIFLPTRVYAFMQRLFECPWCMSIQLSWILLLPFAVEPVESYSNVAWVLIWTGKSFNTALAVSFMANLIHEIFNHNGPSVG